MIDVQRLLDEQNHNDSVQIIAVSHPESTVYAGGGVARPVSEVGWARGTESAVRLVECLFCCEFTWPNGTPLEDLKHDCSRGEE